MISTGAGVPGTDVLHLRGISKTFAATRALDAVELDVRRGEIHALVGENGSGKSTLIKILAGVEPADRGGAIEVAGTSFAADSFSPTDARAVGLRFVHQHATTFASLSVAENIAIGRGFETGLAGRVRWRRLHRRVADVLERFEIDARPETPVERLGPARRTMVAVARALQDQESADDGILVLDEPTASLPRHEVKLLLDTLRRYAAAGQTIVYVTHRLDEVLEVADRITALRDGRSVAVADADQVGHDDLVRMIVGGEPVTLAHEAAQETDPTAALRVSGLRVGPLEDVSFEVRRGEIVGIAGLLGSGRSTLLGAIFGHRPRSGGTVVLEGKPLVGADCAASMRAGVAYVPEDRAAAAIFAQLTVRENLSVTALRQYWRASHISHARERRDSRALMQRFAVRAASEDSPLAQLSGGNQQKVVLARWLRRGPRLLLLDEPTQGIDVGARAEIHAMVGEAVRDGACAIVVSSDFEELSRMCDRVIVIRGGRVVSEVAPPHLSDATLNHLVYREADDAESRAASPAGRASR